MRLPVPPRPCPRCGTRHRNWRTVAACRFGKLLWVLGDAPWASLSRCHPGGTVILYDTLAEAEHAREVIDSCGCGGCCAKQHQVVDLAAAYRREVPA